jgi:hypothetical protein
LWTHESWAGNDADCGPPIACTQKLKANKNTKNEPQEKSFASTKRKNETNAAVGGLSRKSKIQLYPKRKISFPLDIAF